MNYEQSVQGDSGFVGVDAQSLPRLVKPGLASMAINKDFRGKTAAPRLGHRTVLFGTPRTMDFDGYAMPYAFDGYAGLGVVFGTTVFSDPNSYEYALVAVARGTWLLRINAEPAFIGLPIEDAGISGRVVMEQLFGRVLMVRGDNQVPLICDPVEDLRWQSVAQTDARGSDADNTYGDGTETIPNSRSVTGFNNRAFVVVGRDEVAVSDILDVTRYSRASARFYINQGSSDSIVRIFEFNQTTLVVFKGQSVHLLGNVYGKLSDIRSDLLTAERGCMAADSVVSTGKDIWFLSEGGVYSIGQALDNKLQASADPISAPLDPLFRRINWSAANGAQAIIHESKYYLAVPLDGSQYNNAVMVYDFINREWAGYWTSANMDVAAFARISAPNGRRDLYAVGGSGLTDTAAHGAVWRWNAGYEDRLFTSSYEIEDSLTTRGYGPVTGDAKALRLGVEQETWNPRFSIQMVSDGVNEIQVLETDRVKDRAEYYTFGAGVADELNAAGNHGAPYRKDYSILLPGDSLLDWDDFDFDAYVFQQGVADGANPQLHQAATERYKAKNEDRSVQVVVSNTRGRAVQRAVVMEMAQGRVSTGTQV